MTPAERVPFNKRFTEIVKFYDVLRKHKLLYKHKATDIKSIPTRKGQAVLTEHPKTRFYWSLRQGTMGPRAKAEQMANITEKNIREIDKLK